MRDVHSAAPAFSLSCQDYGMVILHRLLEENDFVVLFFFLAAGSPGCTTEGRQMRSTFVVNSKGTITHVFPRVSVHSHPAELLALLASEQGELSAPAPSAPAIAAPAADAQAQVSTSGTGSNTGDGHGDTGATAPPRAAAASVAAGLSAADVVAGFARTSLELLLAHIEAGGSIPADVVQLAARVARR